MLLLKARHFWQPHAGFIREELLLFHHCPSLQIVAFSFTSSVTTHSLPPCYAGTQVSINHPCGWYHQGRELTSSSFFVFHSLLSQHSSRLPHQFASTPLTSQLSEKTQNCCCSISWDQTVCDLLRSNKISVHPIRKRSHFGQQDQTFGFSLIHLPGFQSLTENEKVT